MTKKRIELVYSSLYDKLISEYVPELRLVDRSSLSLRERGTKYRLELSTSLPTAAFCIDGQIIREGLRCDKLVLIDTCCESPNWVEVFVELKGTDVLHAIEQLKATIRKPEFEHPSNKRVKYARIVGHSFPGNKSDISIEKVKKEFRSLYSCDLRAIKSGKPDSIGIGEAQV